MTQYTHIVQVHPVENGATNFTKVNVEKEFNTKEEADWFISFFNSMITEVLPSKAVYLGVVNTTKGELE